MRETKITDAGLRELAKIKQLKTLRLNNTKVTKTGVAQLKKALPKCSVSSSWDWPAEAAIRKELKKPTGELAEADLEKVTELLLDNTGMTDADLKKLVELKRLSFLRLSYTPITDMGLKEVAKLTSLKELVLDGTKITDMGLKEVAKLTQLSTLVLDDTPITDMGLKEVARLTQLQYISLLGTQVTDASVADLQKALPNCKIKH